MIRKAKLGDVPAIVDLAIESVSHNPIPVQVDPAAMREMVETCINPAHFVWVSEVDGVVVGALVAMVQRGFWFKGLQASVLLYYTRKPGDGAKLIAEFARWCKSRSGIKLAIFELEPESDPRLEKYLARLGFNRKSANMSYVRGRGVNNVKGS